MKSCILIIFLSGLCYHLFAQKPPIDTTVFSRWLSVERASITNDGKYTSYVIHNFRGDESLVCQATHGNWKMRINGIRLSQFSDNSRFAIFINHGDSLCFLRLGSQSIEYIPHATSFKLFKNRNAECVAWLVNKPEKKLQIRNLNSGSNLFYNGVIAYSISGNGNVLVLQSEKEKEGKKSQTLERIEIDGNQRAVLWDGPAAQNLIMSNQGDELAFSAEDVYDSLKKKDFWYFKKGMDKALKLIEGHSNAIGQEFTLDAISRFSTDGTRLFFTLKKKEYPKIDPKMVKVDVWSYTDAKLQSQQLNDLNKNEKFSAIINLETKNIIRLNEENETVWLNNERKSEDWTVVTYSKGNENEWFWNRYSKPDYYLESTITGERTKLPISRPFLIPGGEYLLGYDTTELWNNERSTNFLSYDIASGRIHDLSQNLPNDEVYGFGWSGVKRRNLEFVRWLDDGKNILISDQYDAWQVDASGEKAPINLTNGFGRKHHIKFQPALSYFDPPLKNGKELILSVFDLETKKNGFCKIMLGKQNERKLLAMEPYVFNVWTNDYFGGAAPIKARDANEYIVQRESAAHSRNYFLTNDFINYKPLSDVYPEKNYNWLTSELIRFKTIDGENQQGILYKPENFDSTLKYPVIFHYYEKFADGLNEYKLPEPVADNMNIPWFVSHGYLVCVPDIDYVIGKTGYSAFSSVMGAAKYLSRFLWVDSSRMGIQGHSFGGYETKYIVSHTNIFAAAMSSAGMSDFISDYGSIWGDGPSKQGIDEYGQSRLGTTPWEGTDIYIENSPLFRVNEITTPILLMNNKNDGAVAYLSQGVSFFTALRRLGKKAWMLQYDDGAHSLDGYSDDAIDYTIRMTQFFDHYLKGSPAPKWMINGIPAKLKGLDNGLQLEAKGVSPGPGLSIKNN